MSIILFWSPFHGQGQTSNMHALALCANLIYGKSILLMHTQFEKNNLESPLIGQNVDKDKAFDDPLFQDIGLDMAVTYSNMNRLTKNVLESCCISFADSTLLLLPGTEIKNRESFMRDTGRTVGRMIQKANEYVDMVLIDSNSGDDELSFRLMELADVIVINLTQRRYILDRFFADYGEFFQEKKIFYLFGYYDDNSVYNISNCCRKYKKYIRKSNFGLVPYSTRYLDAQNEGSVFSFMQDGMCRDEYGSIKRHLSLVGRRLRAGRDLFDETEYFYSMTLFSTGRLLAVLETSKGDGRYGKSIESKKACETKSAECMGKEECPA